MVHLIFAFWVLVLGAAHAAVKPEPDINGYTNQYEIPLLGPGDTCRAGYKCVTAPTSCDDVIQANDAWNTINWNDDVICIATGDHTGKGQLRTDGGGTFGSDPNICTDYKWLIGSSTGGAIDAFTNAYLKPEGDKVRMQSIQLANNCVAIVGLNIRPEDGDSGIEDPKDGSDRDKIFIFNNEIGPGNVGERGKGIQADDSYVIQYNVIHDIGPRDDFDNVGVSINGNDHDPIIVSNEIFNMSDGVTAGNNSINDSIDNMRIENNDFYLTSARYLPCNDPDNWPNLGVSEGAMGNQCHCAEDGIDLKDGGDGTSTVAVINQNRFFGFKQGMKVEGEPDCGGTGSTGMAFQFNNDTKYVLLKNNWFMENQHNIAGDEKDSKDPKVGYRNEGITIEGNIISDPKAYYDGSVVAGPAGKKQVFGVRLKSLVDDALMWFNTFSNFPNTGDADWVDMSNGNMQFSCNLGYDARNVGSNPSGVVTNSILIEDTDSPGGSVTTLSSGQAQMSAANTCIWRKLLTTPEQYCTNNVQPSMQSPFVAGCSGETQRPGYGYDG